MGTPDRLTRRQADRLIEAAAKRRAAKLKSLLRDFAPEGAVLRKRGVELPTSPKLWPHDAVHEPIAERIDADFRRECAAIEARIAK